MQRPNLPSIYRPERSGEWDVLFRPTRWSSYVNDHSIVRTRDGRWHLYGCAQLSPEVNPENERYIVHGSAGSLSEPMEEHRPKIDNGTRAWAPGVVRNGDRLFMYYGPSPTMMATSLDAQHWMGHPVELAGTPLDAAHRDHMVFQLKPGMWLMYAVGVRDGLGCVSVHVSNDLIQWRFVQYALTSAESAPLKPAWGAMESPFVVKYASGYYLFITYTDCSKSNYTDTLVFFSTNPFDFGTYAPAGDADDPALLITRLYGHASEVIHDPEQNRWFLTCAGWRGFGLPHEGCVSIAPLAWKPDEE
jgi:beta-fructofuranosidase